ncbi:heat shock protein beta-7-like [Melanotaenia boesemani]|uniref:heat shock protein beta-7-like n=1 Tax=Melanotaenia boesemani TaxID=1250792 RepID=UPI001C03AE0B|nr:heat shock protein beta-7-like [Melanotaenia boesemani]
MASQTASSHRSSSSYRSSSRYSSSSYRSEASLNGSSDSLGTLLEPFLDSANCSCLFGDEGPGGPNCLAPFSRHSRSSCGPLAPVGGAVMGWQAGGVRCLGDTYYMSADVSQFEPHDIVVMAYNHHVVIHAQKVLEDGNISNTFTHKSLFPEDMDPLSVSGTLNPDGNLLVSVRRTTAWSVPEAPGVPTFCSEAHL